MKKTIVLWLVSILCLGMMACGGKTEPASDKESESDIAPVNTFSVGYARTVINPNASVPIGGYGNTQNRMSTGNFDYLYATAVAISDKDNETVIFMTLDLGNFGNGYADTLRNSITTATGIPLDHIMVSCTHTHSSPDLWSTGDFQIQQFMTDTSIKCGIIAKKALEDRKPATMSINTAKTENMNYVRRYIMSDGSLAGDNYGTFSGLEIVSHETEADPNLRMIKFTREGGKDVLLTNFQAHATVGSAGHTSEDIFYELSPDFIGPFRRVIEQEKDCLVAYFLGGAGNINPRSEDPKEPVTRDQVEYGTLLAQFALEKYDSCTEVESGAVKVSSDVVSGKTNHEEDALLPFASKLAAVMSSDASQTEKTLALEEAKARGIWNQHHANQIVTKAGLPANLDVNLFAVSIGKVGFAFAPYEMFDTDATAIRDAAGYDMTFVMGYSNGYLGYMPDSKAYDNGGYEQFSCRFVKGESDRFKDSLIAMLKNMK